jgi:hypothetical protein
MRWQGVKRQIHPTNLRPGNWGVFLRIDKMKEEFSNALLGCL